MSIVLPGSPKTLILLMCFFAVKYFFGYLKVAHGFLFEKYGFIEIIVSGIFSGYFIGRSLAYFYIYKSKSPKIK